MKNNHNPQWNFDITFDIDNETPETINLEVFDQDIGKDDALGRARICVSCILNKNQSPPEVEEYREASTG